VTNSAHHMPNALVVGGSSGIGASIAKRLMANHHVSLIARREDRLAEVAGGQASVYPCDVSDGSLLEEAIKKCVSENGKIDYLFYCAGAQMIKPLRSSSVADINRIVDVNLTAALICGALFSSSRYSNREAVFCAISSIAAQRPEPGILAYSAAKAGIDALVRGLARECAPKRAVAIAPGWLDTEMTKSYSHVYDELFLARLKESSPRGIATVEEVVDLAMYLVSGLGRSITGQTITIDGGASL
jgi:NAD(P)-dependent dehydrogenase (short-subunit alcohol dehydrogenase family)